MRVTVSWRMIATSHLITSLRTALKHHGWKVDDFQPLPVKGVGHDHIRLMRTGLIARLPCASPLGLPVCVALDREIACFQRTAPSRHTPRLHAFLAPSETLRFGALLVDEIVGHPPRLPQDLPALAQALAALHSLDVPPPQQRIPLLTPKNPQTAPLDELLTLIHTRLSNLSDKVMPRKSRMILSDVLTEAQTYCQQCPPCPASLIRLIGTDTHPGNFLIDPTGKAWFVDLEKVMYGLPTIDLAHATLYTSTMWDKDVCTILTPQEITKFYRTWRQNVPASWDEEARVWFDVTRRVTWLRTLSWMASRPRSSLQRLPIALRVHIKQRLANFFAPQTIEWVRDSLYLSVDP